MAQIFDWYKVISIADFEKNNTPSMDIVINTEEYGELNIQVCKGIFYALVFGNTYLPIGLNEQNPYVKNNLAAYQDDIESEGAALWLGFINED